MLFCYDKSTRSKNGFKFILVDNCCVISFLENSNSYNTLLVILLSLMHTWFWNFSPDLKFKIILDTNFQKQNISNILKALY